MADIIRQTVAIADPDYPDRKLNIDQAGNIFIRPTDGAGVDAFGRWRVSNSSTVFDSSQEYSSHPLLFDHHTAGTGTATHSLLRNSTTLATGGVAVGARALRQSKVYWRYQPGKSKLVKITAVPLTSGSVVGLQMVRRSNTTGAPVDTAIAQVDWNVDCLDGSGQSEIVLDAQKSQIFIIDLQWLSVGRVRTGFQIAGQLYYAHEFIHANQTVGAYMRTANLPVRWEVVNTASGPRVRMGYFDDDNGVFFEVVASGTVASEAICVSVESEGGVQEVSGYTFSAGTAGVSVSCANTVALTPLLTLRLKDTFNGLTYRGHVRPNNLESLVSGNSAYWELLWNATLTGATFANSAEATYSGVEFDTAASAVTGGVRLESGYFGAGSGSSRLSSASGLSNKLLLARTYAGARDTLTLAARGVGGVATVAVSLDFAEIY